MGRRNNDIIIESYKIQGKISNEVLSIIRIKRYDTQKVLILYVH